MAAAISQTLAEVPGREDPDPDAVSVVIAGSDALVRAGIRSILERSQVRVLEEAVDGHSAVNLVRLYRPAVLIVDATAPGSHGLATTAMVRGQAPDTKVIFMAPDAREDLLFQALGAGATGFLLRQCAPGELVRAVLEVAAGHAALAARAARRLVDQVAGIDMEGIRQARDMIDSLTGTERKVLGCLADGLRNAQIGNALHLSEGAVKAHVSRLLAKLGCSNRVQASAIFYNASLVSC